MFKRFTCILMNHRVSAMWTDEDDIAGGDDKAVRSTIRPVEASTADSKFSIGGQQFVEEVEHLWTR